MIPVGKGADALFSLMFSKYTARTDVSSAQAARPSHRPRRWSLRRISLTHTVCRLCGDRSLDSGENHGCVF